MIHRDDTYKPAEDVEGELQTSGRRGIRTAFGALLLALVAMLGVRFAVQHSLIRSDGLSYYAYMPSAFIDGDLDFTNQFRDHNPHGDGVPNIDRKTPTGLVPNKYPIGQALLWAPFFIAAHWLVLGSQALGASVAAHGYSPPYHLAIGLGSLFYGWLGLLGCYRLSLRFHRPWPSALAVVAVALASNLVYYLTVEPAMSHALSMFAVTFFASSVPTALA